MKFKIFFISLLLVLLVISGCGTKDKSTQNNEIIEKKSIETAQDLALSLSDLPDNETWQISTRGERTKSDISQDGISLGWAEGYNIVFVKKEIPSIALYQYTSRYPKENITLVLNSQKDVIKLFNEGLNGIQKEYALDNYGRRYRFEELSKFNIGEDSISTKTLFLDDNEVFYKIEFVKN